MNNYLEQLEKDLICPISLELLDNPITVPCCKKAFSKVSLQEYLRPNLRAYYKCPLCREDLSFFDVNNAPIEMQLVGLLDTFLKLKNQNDAPVNNQSNNVAQNQHHKWT